MRGAAAAAAAIRVPGSTMLFLRSFISGLAAGATTAATAVFPAAVLAAAGLPSGDAFRAGDAPALVGLAADEEGCAAAPWRKHPFASAPRKALRNIREI